MTVTYNLHKSKIHNSNKLDEHRLSSCKNILLQGKSLQDSQ